MKSRPCFRKHILIVGAGDRARRLFDAIQSRADPRLRVAGWAGASGSAALDPEAIASAISSCVNRAHHFDRIIVAVDGLTGLVPAADSLDLSTLHVNVQEVTTLLEEITGKIELDHLCAGSGSFTDGFVPSRSVIIARRLISLLIAAGSLLLLAPLLPLIAIAVKLSSPGPVLIKQKRVGLGNSIFTLYKFRTMRQDAEKDNGAVWAQKDDPRVTLVGRLLRRSRLDEIPQLWNVLRGDMDFVGPRPERPEFVQWLAETIPCYSLRHTIRPGLTGWAQVRYKYCSTLEETTQKLAYDLYYIKHLKLSLDFLIAFETFKTILLLRGAQ